MSKVALRLYNREIEALIDQGHIDESVAHCQHILKTYPKHLETYRLLGKAHLEGHRYADAADIFQRVLLAVPDDFVSHLGMSIICDEQKDLDGAIWHMERAFEISSTNAGVQGELRRLRGRRDGMEPPKIQLTRGALAQIYAKGGEYQQAITEIKAVLAEDETRMDMKTLLARAYFRAGMRNDATEACIDLLKQYPYNLDGNRILVEILSGTSMSQGVDQYKKRIQALDPYLAMVSGSVFNTDGIPDNAVMIDRLEWDPSSQPVSSWNMQDTGTAPEIVSPASAPAAPAEEIPDWMKQSGWGQATGEFKEGPVNFDEPEPAAPAAGGELAAAEIPDWLKAMAPPGATTAEAASVSADETSEAADFDWLAGLGAETGGNLAGPGTLTPAEPASFDTPSVDLGGSDSDLDWLNNLGSTAAPAAATGLAADAGLDWLDSLNPAQDEKSVQPETSLPVGESLPDWLTSMDDSQQAATPEQPVANTVPEQPAGFDMSVEQPSVEQPSIERTPDWGVPQTVVPAQSESVADWLNDLSGEGADQSLSKLVSGPGISESEQDESLKWLESLAEKQGAKAEELITNPSERSESVPDWVNKVEETPVEPKIQVPAEYIPEKPIEVEAEPVTGELSPVLSGPGTTESEQDDAFKWLEGLAAGQGAKAEELLTKPEERQEQAPGWVGEVESRPTELSALISGPGTSSSDQDDAMLWLESLAQKQGAKPEELITKPEDRQETAPDWVNKVGQIPDQIVQPEPVQEVPAQPVKEVEPPAPRVRAAGEEGFVPGPLSELISGPGTTEAEQDAALLWLESLAQKQGAKPEELITKPEERQETAPDWVNKVGQVPDQIVQLEPVQEVPAQPVEEVEPPAPRMVDGQPVELSALISGPGTTESEQDAALLWLELLAQKQGAKPEELITKPEERQETAPDWVNKVGQVPDQIVQPEPVQEIPPQPEREVEPPAPRARAAGEEGFVPGPLSELLSGPGTTEAEQDDALLWLESLAQKQGAKPEELITKPEERKEFAPEWVSKTVQEPAVEPEPAAPAELPPAPISAQSDDALAWLQGLSAEEPVAAAQPEDQDWLKDLVKPVEEAPSLLPLDQLEPEVVEPATPQVPSDTLDWLASLGQNETLEQTEPMPWEQLAPDETAQPETMPAELLEPQAVEPVTPAAASDALDWLAGLGESKETEQAEPVSWDQPTLAETAYPEAISAESLEPQAVEPATPAATSDALAWLASLGESKESEQAEPMPWDQQAPAEAVPAEPLEPQAASEDAAAWLASLGESKEPEQAEPISWDQQPPTETAYPETIYAESLEPQAVEPATPVATSDALAWLASLGESKEPEQAEPMPWDQQAPAEAVPAEPLEPQAVEPVVAPVLDTSAWLASLEQSEVPEQVEPMPWEQTESAETAQPEASQEEPSQAVEQPTPAELQPQADISDWLKNLDVQHQTVSSGVEKAASESEELPDWLKDTSADEQIPEPEPALSWMPTDEIPSQPPTEMEPAKETATQAPGEVIPAVSVEASTSQPVAESVSVPPVPQRPVLRQTGMLGGDKDTLAIQRARDLLGRGGLDASMGEYTKLIKKSKLLEEVIYDLQEAVYSHPVDVVVWQTLGDAYMRLNRLQDALDAYSKAEELLR